MRIPNPLQVLRMVKSAVANADQWEQQADHQETVTDPNGLVEVTFLGRTNRFKTKPRILGDSATADELVSATVQACNLALEKSEQHWASVHKRLGQ